MVNIKTQERDHHLIVTMGGELEFSVPPLGTADGLLVLRHLLGLGGADAPTVLGLAMAPEEYARAAERLRSAELSALVDACLYWRAFGGTDDEIQSYLAQKGMVEWDSAREGRFKSGRTPKEATLEDLAEFGVGEPDPKTGFYPKYNYPKWFQQAIQALGKKDGDGPAGVEPAQFWHHILKNWYSDVMCDVRQVYGLRMSELESYPWWETRAYVLGLVGSYRARVQSWVMEDKE